VHSEQYSWTPQRQSSKGLDGPAWRAQAARQAPPGTPPGTPPGSCSPRSSLGTESEASEAEAAPDAPAMIHVRSQRLASLMATIDSSLEPGRTDAVQSDDPYL
jgi:hypothetical protein